MTRSAQTTDFDFTHRSLPTEVDTQRRSKNLYLLLSLTAVLIFAFAGALMLPLLGLQTDEVMFVHDLWHPREAFYSISFQRLVIPSMVTSYAGELKCWLYAPLLKIAPFSVWAVPEVVPGAARCGALSCWARFRIESLEQGAVSLESVGARDRSAVDRPA
jgi:hypothetical protein